jgi:cytochrome P450
VTLPQDIDLAVPPDFAVPADIAAPPDIAADGGAALLAWFERMRADRPVWQDDTGAWHVFRYADVQSVSTDSGRFSSDATRLDPNGEPPPPGTLLVIDPPTHRTLRRLVSQAFTPRMVAGLAPRIAEVTADLLAELAPDETEFDLIDALAYPLPVIVIAELLGVPAADRTLFRRWADSLMSLHVDDPSTGLDVWETIQEMDAYLLAQTLDRRAHPRDDLISQLVLAEVDGVRLTDEEVINFTALLLLAGHVTTTMLLGNALLCLDENPAVLRAVCADRSLVPAVLEEVLRLRPPFPRVARVTTEDVEVAGTVIPASSMVWPWVLSANRDERQFPDATRFDPYRVSTTGHAAFGHGVHYCLGAPLARLEGRIALTMLLERFGELRLTPGSPVPFHTGGVFGVRQLSLTRPGNVS